MAKPISARRLEANRRNAQLSTGPRTVAGKARSSRNALRHGMTAKVFLLDEDQRPEFERFKAAFIERFAPADERESRVVNDMLPIAWKLARLAEVQAKALIDFERSQRTLGPVSIAQLLKLDFEHLAQQRKTDGAALTRTLLLDALRPLETQTGLPMLTYGRYEQRLEQQFFKLLRQLGKLRRKARSANIILARSNPKSSATEVKNDVAA